MRIPFVVLALLLIFAEIAVYILVGRAIGVLPTLALGLLSMIAGTLLLRRQGMAAVLRMRSDFRTGRLPARPLLEGAVIAFAALLMILPGFITDVVGILLFVPALRSALGQWLVRRIEARSPRERHYRPARGRVVELDSSEYGSPLPSDTPWRPKADRS